MLGGYIAFLAAGVILGSLGFFLLRRRGSGIESPELRPEDRQLLQYLAERGGKVLESELRQKFLLPRTSAWRQVRRLERMGYLRINKEGIQNEIELVKKGWNPLS